MLRGIWHRRWIGLGVAWMVAIIGAVVVFRLPDKYEASARVYVDTQSLLRPLLAGMTVIPDAGQQVGILSRILLTRPNVAKIIRKSDLDTAPRKSRPTLDRRCASGSLTIAARDRGQHLHHRVPVARWAQGARCRAGRAVHVHRAKHGSNARRHR